MSSQRTAEPAAPQDGRTAADTLRVAFVGEVDHGKSTLLGRLLLDTGAMTQDRLGTPVEDGGLAFLLDGLSEERDDLFTLDTAQAIVDTPHRRFVLIDVPGHFELLKNMVTGASRADLGVVVVDCLTGVTAQTRRHLRILELLGVTTVVCAITKMDLAGYAEEVFHQVSGQLAAVAGECGVQLAAVVPVSAIDGRNVTAPADIPWYADEPLLDTLHTTGNRCAQHSLTRFVVQAVVGRPGARKIAGRVESGTLRPGLLLTDGTGGSYTLRSIERHGEQALDAAHPGDSVGLVVDGGEPAPGVILAPADQPAQVGHGWRARILSTAETGIPQGLACTIRYASTSVAGTIERIEHRWDSATYTPITDGGPIGFTELAQIRLRFDGPVVADDVRSCAPTGRFMLCDHRGHALALGVIDHVEGAPA